jgi:hypothetical protein
MGRLTSLTMLGMAGGMTTESMAVRKTARHKRTSFRMTTSVYLYVKIWKQNSWRGVLLKKAKLER